MVIEFYKTTDDPKKINKTMDNIGSGTTTLSATVNNTADSITLLSPIFLVASNTLYFTATHIKCADMGNRWRFDADLHVTRHVLTEIDHGFALRRANHLNGKKMLMLQNFGTFQGDQL